MIAHGADADRCADAPAALARLLARPYLLDALARRDIETLRREVTSDPALLAMMTGLDVVAVRYSLRRLQRKRLEIIEPVFPVSLAATRGHYGSDDLAVRFWASYQPPSGTAAHELVVAVAAGWIRFTAHLAGLGPLRWLGDLSRYELMRWQAAVFAEPSPGTPACGDDDHLRPSLAPGAKADAFTVEVSLLLGTIEGDLAPRPEVSRLITWYQPAAGVRTARLGAALYDAVLACDGGQTIGQIAAAMESQKGAGAAQQVSAALRALARVGALRLTALPPTPPPSAGRAVPAE